MIDTDHNKKEGRFSVNPNPCDICEGYLRDTYYFCVCGPLDIFHTDLLRKKFCRRGILDYTDYADEIVHDTIYFFIRNARKLKEHLFKKSRKYKKLVLNLSSPKSIVDSSAIALFLKTLEKIKQSDKTLEICANESVKRTFRLERLERVFNFVSEEKYEQEYKPIFQSLCPHHQH